MDTTRRDLIYCLLKKDDNPCILKLFLILLIPMKSEKCPFPKHQGSVLIKRVIQLLRSHNIPLPLSKVVIGNSGGSDSMALAHLLIKYGRRVVAKENITLVHINHSWRGEESDGDEIFVHEYAQRMGVPIQIHKLIPPTKEQLKGESPELLARNERKRIYSDLAKEGMVVLTAHHANDLAETLIWRLCSGKFDSYDKGILVQVNNEIRPFLSSTKAELQTFLKEENLTWREDRTNHEGELLRSKMRKTLMPNIDEIFPKTVPNLISFALAKQLPSKETNQQTEIKEVLEVLKKLNVPSNGPDGKVLSLTARIKAAVSQKDSETSIKNVESIGQGSKV